MESKISQRKPCLVAKVSTTTITSTSPGLKRVAAVRSRRLTDVRISVPYVNSIHYLAENILLPTRRTWQSVSRWPLSFYQVLGQDWRNYGTRTPKWHAAFTVVPIVFIPFAQPASLYCEFCIYMNKWLRRDCTWIYVATK